MCLLNRLVKFKIELSDTFNKNIIMKSYLVPNLYVHLKKLPHGSSIIKLSKLIPTVTLSPTVTAPADNFKNSKLF